VQRPACRWWHGISRPNANEAAVSPKSGAYTDNRRPASRGLQTTGWP